MRERESDGKLSKERKEREGWLLVFILLGVSDYFNNHITYIYI